MIWGKRPSFKLLWKCECLHFLKHVLATLFMMAKN